MASGTGLIGSRKDGIAPCALLRPAHGISADYRKYVQRLLFLQTPACQAGFFDRAAVDAVIALSRNYEVQYGNSAGGVPWTRAADRAPAGWIGTSDGW